MKTLPVIDSTEFIVTIRRNINAYSVTINMSKLGINNLEKYINIIPTSSDAMVVVIRLVPTIFDRSFVGKKRIMEKSNPSLEKRLTIPSNDINAVARPTSSNV